MWRSSREHRAAVVGGVEREVAQHPHEHPAERGVGLVEADVLGEQARLEGVAAGAAGPVERVAFGAELADDLDFARERRVHRGEAAVDQLAQLRGLVVQALVPAGVVGLGDRVDVAVQPAGAVARRDARPTRRPRPSARGRRRAATRDIASTYCACPPGWPLPAISLVRFQAMIEGCSCVGLHGACARLRAPVRPAAA